MFSFFRKKSPPATPDPDKTVVPDATTVAPDTLPPSAIQKGTVRFSTPGQAQEDTPVVVSARTSWTQRLRAGLRRTGSNIATVFTGTRIDEALYEDLGLREEFEGLQVAFQQLPRVTFRPSSRTIQDILKYSEKTALEKHA